MKRVVTVAAMLLCSLSVFAQPTDAIQSWTAPPYWAPPQAAPEGSGDHGGRDALAAGRQALVTSPVPLPFVAVTPCRVIDTRSDSGFPADYGPPSILGGGTQRTFVISGQCGIPSDAKAVSFNFTVWNTSTRGDLRVFPAGSATPVVSTLNWEANILALANAAVVPLSGAGAITVQIDGPGTVDIFADINGYYSPLGIVNSVNTLTGDLAISAGTNVSLTQTGNTLTIAATPGSGGPPTGPAGGALTGTYPNPGLAGSFASLGANTFTGTQTIIGGNLALPATTGPTVGVLTLGGQSFLHAYGGSTNTFVGPLAGGGFANSGAFNAAFGADSLFYNTTGSSNAAFGMASLYSNTTGNSNAAFGGSSLVSSTTGNSNAAFGADSLFYNTTGSSNAAFGADSLFYNTTGSSNAAFGAYSLYLNTTGFNNAAFGPRSLNSNTTGFFNSAFGAQSLFSNTTGLFNIAIGFNAGFFLTTGDNNIDIGNSGLAAEGNTIRIGTTGTQTSTFIAGIRGVTTALTAIPVLIDSNGQLGTVSSSRRFKDDIADMDAASSALMSLRPVTFHYKTDQNPSGRTLQYGLIAEEVAEVYPGLVARSADGQIETVLYQFLPSMLLNEYQKQQAQIVAQRAEIDDLKAKLLESEGVMAAVRELGARLARAEARLAETR